MGRQVFTEPVWQDPSAEAGVARSPLFVDLFAGCGGLSLGLAQAGWRGLFAVEKDSYAFETFRTNLLDSPGSVFEWPAWLPMEPIDIRTLIGRYARELGQLTGTVDLLAGGPPCQGFSFAGCRKEADPRNLMFKHYVKVVSILRPRLLLIENVPGIARAFSEGERSTKSDGRSSSYAEQIAEALTGLDYKVYPDKVLSADFGVPQWRERFIFVAVRDDGDVPGDLDPYLMLERHREQFLRSHGLSVEKPVSARQALSDLETSKRKLVPSSDSPGFSEVQYRRPLTAYQRLMHIGAPPGQPNSLRLARHRPATVALFKAILRTCRRGVNLHPNDRLRLGVRKNCLVPMHPDLPAPTLTTLPDDLLHYSEPRILSVREYARLQGFPDWFRILGKYTTGGHMRVHECPRYTQIGNAVPPLLAEALGEVLLTVHSRLAKENAADAALVAVPA
jgi:DNA (cytosine-5)-methyltransferase 1